MTTFSSRPARILRAAFLAAAVPCLLAAQQGARSPKDSARLANLSDVVTTATRTPVSVIDAPVPVFRLDSSIVRLRLPYSAADLLREFPGFDVTGVRTNQSRPVIRGQRGQRILLLEDGI